MRRRPSLAAKVVLSVLSIALSLAVAEAMVGVVRRHAFPYLNIYEASAEYGVRLSPNATTHVRSRSGRVTEISTNDEGFRGAVWPTNGGVLLLGDSQMFGYNVDEANTTAAGLRAHGHAVLNAAVPTWGPTEYVRIAEATIAKHRPSAVLFVANVANDWYETKVLNVERSAAVDGWLTRKRRGAETPTPFLGRRWLMSRSHLVFVVRAAFAHGEANTAPPATAALRLLNSTPELGRPTAEHRSRMTSALLAVQSMCRAHGCAVVAAVLPLDVQVHEAEWSKYRSRAVNMAPTRRLATDFIVDAEEHEIVAVDLFDALVGASPGAFLNDDYHLSAKGHRAVADVLADALLRAQRKRSES